MTISVYSASQGPIGRTEYRFVGVTAPAQYIPRLTMTTKQNTAGTNVDSRIDVSYPLVTEVDGVSTAPNTFRASVTFTALQSVVNNTERVRVLDELIAFLTANKTKIVNGDATVSG